jgi:glutathione gamma-glutamylcysteinyltransferase
MLLCPQMLDCCRPLEDVKREGITLPQAACLARCNGAHVELQRFGSFSLEDLRKHVSIAGGDVMTKAGSTHRASLAHMALLCACLFAPRQVLEVCSSGEEHLVVSYSRRTFLQTGDGHFSPVGGYHAQRDLVLILDVVSKRLRG